jgi:hypothetical protein
MTHTFLYRTYFLIKVERYAPERIQGGSRYYVHRNIEEGLERKTDEKEW